MQTKQRRQPTSKKCEWLQTPYIQGTSQEMARIMEPHGFRTKHEPNAQC